MNSSTFRIATYNILKPLNPISWIIPTIPRYKYIIQKIIPNLNPRILCLNETNELFISMLKKDNLINSTYNITPIKCTKKGSMNAIILSKDPIKILHHRTRKLIVLIKIGSHSVIMCNRHTQSLEQKHQHRRKQLIGLESTLKQILEEPKKFVESKEDVKLIKEAFKNKNVFLLGDLNLHMKGETKLLCDMDYRDLWLETKPNDDGYTWDPKKNKMINWFLFFDNRRMRLDRICVKQESKLVVDDIFIFGNKQIGKWYLFPSDHFGIAADVKFGKKEIRIDYSKLWNNKLELMTGFRTIKTIIFMRNFLLLIMILAIIFISWKLRK